MTNIKEIQWQKDGINIKTGYNDGLIKCKVDNLEFYLEKTGWDWITMNFIRGLIKNINKIKIIILKLQENSCNFLFIGI